jgi:magnesium transporter
MPMIQIFKTNHQTLESLDRITPNSWINMTDPTEEEIDSISKALSIERDFITDALDKEERSRFEMEEKTALILVNTPFEENQEGRIQYVTLPLAIILTEENIVTVSLKETPVLKNFHFPASVDFSTSKRNRFILKILYHNAEIYLSYLKQVDKNSTEIETRLHKSMKNKELIQMLRLEKSLVYFSTSLKANETVLEKLLRMPFIKAYPEDEDLLEDVIIENNQAIEMCQIYTDILIGTMDAFASVISNNLNIVMKLLTSITILLTIPTLIASLWGMNVPVPFQYNPYGFWIVLGISVGAAVIGLIYMFRKKML